MAIALGNCFHRDHDPATVVTQSRAAEQSGYDEFWVIEDCFFTAGPSLAAASLVATESIGVGIGIMPTAARNPAVTAMEIATLSQLAPGRFHAGIGHGVQSWMAQMNERRASPLTMLSETLSSVRSLLAGERLTVSGRYVTLDDVKLEVPPSPVPKVSAGVRGPKSLAIAGRHADGTIMADFVNPAYLDWAGRQIADGIDGVDDVDGHRITVFATMAIGPDGDEMRAAVAPFLAEICAEAPLSLRMAPFFDELAQRADGSSWLEAVSAMPVEWWHDIAAVGTPDDAAEYLGRLERSGADAVALFPNPVDPIGDLTQAIEHLRRAGV
ncbi:MAG: LLM class flavin-dependent oxidoreductase [Acidimicrobiales bacterium]